MRKLALFIIETLWLAVTIFAETDPVQVIVFPLSGSPKSESIAWVGKGIAVSLSDQLKGPRLNVLAGGQITELMEDMGFFRPLRLSRASMIRIAQQASADLAVMGSFEGTEKNMAISVRVFYLEDLKLSGNISANGPLSVLPQMENEMAWQILTDIDVEKSLSREQFYERTRKVPNAAFQLYIQSLDAENENDRHRLLLKAVETYENFPEAQFRLGSLYYRKGDCKSALPHLELSAHSDQPSADADFQMGTCYLLADQPELAVDSYSRILRFSRPMQVLNNLGTAYVRESENARALKAFREANILAPADPIVSLNLSIAQHLQGNQSAATSTAEKAIKLNPQYGMLQFLLGFLQKSRGEDRKAEVWFQKATAQGISVEKHLAEKPETWLRFFSEWSSADFLDKGSAPQ